MLSSIEKKDAGECARTHALVARLLAVYNDILPFDACGPACASAGLEQERAGLSSAMRGFVLRIMPSVRSLDEAMAADIDSSARELVNDIDAFCATAQGRSLDLRPALTPFKVSLAAFREEMTGGLADETRPTSRRRLASSLA